MSRWEQSGFWSRAATGTAWWSRAREYRKICEAIAAAMRELVDPRSGRKVTRQVTLAHEEFQGPFVDGLPDITILWDQSFAWHEVTSPAIGRLTLRRQDSRTGSHTATGFLLARGYGERPGTELPRGTLYDIAPTVLSAAEVEIPSVMDGRPAVRSVLRGSEFVMSRGPVPTPLP